MLSVELQSVTININEYVWVKLTDHGRATLNSDHRRRISEDKDGWSRWQLWELMQHFGPMLYNGCTLPFETTISLIKPR